MGFLAKGVSINVLNVELQVIVHGLKLAWETGNHVVCCKIDNYEAYCILSIAIPGNRDGLEVLCHEIRDWLNRDWTVQLKHVHRSVNLVADRMAKLSTREQESLCVWHAPPNCVMHMLATELNSS